MIRRAKRHLHACGECGRPFYLCSDRDCTLEPKVCQACEMDRQDGYLSQLETTQLTQDKDQTHAKH